MTDEVPASALMSDINTDTVKFELNGYDIELEVKTSLQKEEKMDIIQDTPLTTQQFKNRTEETLKISEFYKNQVRELVVENNVEAWNTVLESRNKDDKIYEELDPYLYDVEDFADLLSDEEKGN